VAGCGPAYFYLIILGLPVSSTGSWGRCSCLRLIQETGTTWHQGIWLRCALPGSSPLGIPPHLELPRWLFESW